MTGIKGICWDVDGVQVVTADIHTDKKMAIAAENGIDLPDEVRPTLVGTSVDRVWKRLKDKYGLNVSKELFKKQCEEYYMSRSSEVKPRKGAKEAFNHFASLNTPQCSVSSGERQEVDFNLKIASVDKLMAFSISANDVTKTKPNPEPYLTAVLRLREKFRLAMSEKNNSQFIAIEDSVPGATAGLRAGLTTILWSENKNIECPGAIIVHNKADFLKVCRHLTAENTQNTLSAAAKAPPISAVTEPLLISSTTANVSIFPVASVAPIMPTEYSLKR